MTRVLVVDDEPGVRAVLERALRLDYEVDVAEDGRGALDAWRSRRPTSSCSTC